MKIKAVSGIFLTLSLTSMLTLAFSIQQVKAEPKARMVPDEFLTIQEAINAADEGDIIQVKAGIYYENVVLNKSVTLQARAKFSTTLIGDYNRPVIRITTNNVQVEGFILQNGSRGVHIEGAHYGIIRDNVVILNDDVGIFLDCSNNNIIHGNTLHSNGWDGIYVLDSNNNTLTENTSFFNAWYGMFFESSNNNTVANNIVADNKKGGFYMVDSSGSHLIGNTIKFNKAFGIGFYKSSDNLFYYNNIVNNTYQIDNFESVNFWNCSAQGNYWSDYTGTDINADGIGETPYIIDAENKDNYPLMHPWTPNRIFEVRLDTLIHQVVMLCNSTVTGFQFNQTLEQISFYASDSLWTRGFCNVTIPKTFLLDEPWLIFVGGKNMTAYTMITENSTHTSLYFTYDFQNTPQFVRIVASKDNVSPIADAGPDQTINEDTIVILDGSGSYDNVGIVNYTWTFTDTTLKTLTGIKPSYVFETPGEYIITLNVTDTVGNWNTSTCIITVLDITPPIADITPPIVSILSPENKTYPVTDIPLTFTVTESTSWIGYSLDGQTNATITGNITLSGLSDGLHSLIVYANDIVENTGASEIVYFTIETSPPEPSPFEPFQTGIIATIVIIVALGTAVYVFKIRKKS